MVAASNPKHVRNTEPKIVEQSELLSMDDLTPPRSQEEQIAEIKRLAGIDQ